MIFCSHILKKNYIKIFLKYYNISKLSLFKSFLSFCFNFEFDAKKLYDENLDKKEKSEFNDFLENLRCSICSSISSLDFQNVIKKVDEVSISLAFPKYQNGFILIIKIPKLRLLELRMRNYEKRKKE